MSEKTLFYVAYGTMWIVLFFVGYINRNKDDRCETLMYASMVGFIMYIFCLIGTGVMK